MADNSAIEWTDATWNPIRARNKKTGKVGWHCEHATTGCEFCYAEGFNKRLGTGLAFKPGHRQGIEIFLDDNMLTQPLRWKKPRMIFVCSMTDLFAEFVPDAMLDKIFAVMALTPQHTYQVLTKRAARMRDYILAKRRNAPEWIHLPSEHGNVLLPYEGGWPTNVWLGVSAERQQEADERIPLLLQTPAATRFISAEPLLGPIDLTDHCNGHYFFNSLTGTRWHDDPDHTNPEQKFAPGLDWVIAGGESGRNARPMEPAWVRSMREQCENAGVDFFFKQWGEWAPFALGEPTALAGEYQLVRVGKKAAGRLLDGIEYNGMPRRAAMNAPYHTHKRVLADVPDGTPLCAECKQPHDRKGQRHCRKCHAAYQRQWSTDQARMAREFRQKSRSFHGKQTVSGPQAFIVTVEKFGEARYSAASPQQARSLAWKAFRNVSEGLSYAEFIRISSVRKAAERAA
jgi:protein gp37